MTREEAIDLIKLAKAEIEWEYSLEYQVAFDMAIKALEQEPVLDKIRSEIFEEKEHAYADFEQYKIDYLDVDAEYVEDELPYDDFRYGMERCIEIINKYKAGSEE